VGAAEVAAKSPLAASLAIQRWSNSDKGGALSVHEACLLTRSEIETRETRGRGEGTDWRERGGERVGSLVRGEENWRRDGPRVRT